MDTVVLGCTHYPLLRKVIARVAGDAVELVNPAFESARELRMVLEENGLLNTEKNSIHHQFFVSDGAEKCREFANSILPCEIIETKDVNVKTF